jgi:hypothetical protein
MPRRLHTLDKCTIFRNLASLLNKYSTPCQITAALDDKHVENHYITFTRPNAEL